MRNPVEITAKEARAGRSSRRVFHSRGVKWLIYALAIIAVGVLVGSQISNPNKRLLEGAIGLMLVLYIWNHSILGAVLFLMTIYPFPFGFSLGYSNAFLVGIVFIIFLMKVASKTIEVQSNKAFNIPLLLIILSYLASFLNLDYAGGFLKPAIVRGTNLVAVILFFFLIVNFINDEKRLRKAVLAVIASTALIIAFTIIELLFPGKVIIPNWLYTEHRAALVMKGLRMGGPFRDYELLAEYSALCAPVIFLMQIRSKRLLMQMLYGTLLIADLFIMFTTITRGAFISLGIGFVYMLFICRRDLNFVRFVLVAGGFLALVLVLEFIAAQYTVTGSLFTRLGKTTFEKGGIPTARYLGWTQGIQRGMWHPFFGNGLELDWAKGVKEAVYPHNGYLFLFDLTGFFGLTAYLFMLYRLLKASFAGIGSSLVNAPFSHAFMKILNVWLLMFMIDQLKIDYVRNGIYVYFVWMFFGLIAATKNVMDRSARQEELVEGT